MTSEIKGYDEDLTKEIGILEKGIVKVENASGDAKLKVFRNLELKLANARNLYSSFISEYRELEPQDRALFAKKGEDHKSKLNGLTKQMATLKSEIERKEFGLDDNQKTTEEILQEAKKIQNASYESTERSIKVISETRQVGEGTLHQLAEDKEKLQDVHVTLEDIGSELDLAKKQLKSIARKVTSGKICRGLCIIVLMAVLGIVIYLIVKPSAARGSPEGDRPPPPAE